MKIAAVIIAALISAPVFVGIEVYNCFGSFDEMEAVAKEMLRMVAAARG